MKFGTVELPERQHAEFCKRGHPRTPDNLSGRACKTCERERQARWTAENPDKVREKARRHYYQNIEAERARALNWYRENRERATATTRRRRAKNPEKQRAEAKRWVTENPERWAELQRKYKRRRMFGGDDPETIAYVEMLSADPCCFCGEPATSIEHIVPLTGGGPNHWTNYSAACHSCNSRKHNMPLLTFLRRKAA